MPFTVYVELGIYYLSQDMKIQPHVDIAITLCNEPWTLVRRGPYTVME